MLDVNTECQNCRVPMVAILSVVEVSPAMVDWLWVCLPTADCSEAGMTFVEGEEEEFVG